MIENTLILITLILIGYFSKQLNVLKKEDASVLTKILVTFMLPMVTIGNFSKANVNLNLIYFTLSSMISLTAFLILGYFIAKMFKLKEKTSKSFILMFGSYWGATFAYPIILLFFGDIGFQKFIFYDLTLAIYVVTILNYIALSNNGYNLKQNMIKLFTNPMFLSLPIALILNLINFQSSFTDSLFEIIPKGIIFLGLMIVGLNLDFKISNYKLPLILITIKTFVGILLGILIVYIFGFTGLDKTIILVSSVLPPSLMAMIYSQQNNLDKEFVANTLSLSLPIALIFISLVIYFF